MLARIALAAALVAALSGCGASALRRHAMAAEAMDAALAADAAAFEARVRLEVRRGAEDCADEEDFATCVRAEAHGVADELERWEAAHNAASAALTVYIGRLQSMAADGDPEASLADVRPFIEDVIRIFRHLAEAARTYGVDVPDTVEALTWLMRLL
jgi:hypothetical protein